MQAAKSKESGEVGVKAQTEKVHPVEDETLERQKAKTRRVEKKEHEEENAVVHQPPDMEKPKLNEPGNAIPEGAGGKSSNGSLLFYLQ